MRKAKLHSLAIALMGVGVLSSCFTDYADDADLKVVLNKKAEKAVDWSAYKEEAAKLDKDLRAYYENERLPKNENAFTTVDHWATLPDGSKVGFVDLGLESGTLWAVANLGSNATTQYTKTIDDFFDEPFVIPELPVFETAAEQIDESSLSLKEYEERVKNTKTVANYDKEQVENFMQEYREKVYHCDHLIFVAADKMRADYNKFLASNFFGTTNGDAYLWGNAEPVTVNNQLKDNLPLELGDDEDPVTKLLGKGYATPTIAQLEELIFLGASRFNEEGSFEVAVRFDNWEQGMDRENRREVIFPVFAENGITAKEGYYLLVKDRGIDEEERPQLRTYKISDQLYEQVFVPITDKQVFYVRAVKNKQ